MIKRLVNKGRRIFGGARSRYNQTRTFTEAHASFNQSDNLLVIGLPRSGTSMAYRLINVHPDIYLSYEAVNGPFITENRAFELSLYYYEVLKQHQHLVKITEGEPREPFSKPPLYNHRYQYLGDKSIFQSHNPHYKEKLVKRVRENERLKVIFIVRDPRARLLSLFRWHEKRNRVFRATAEIQYQNADFVKGECHKWNDFLDFAGKFDSNERVKVVRYEDLTRDNSQLKEIITFLGLEKGEQLITYHDQHVSNFSAEAWRKELDQQWLEIIAQYSAEGLTEYYPPPSKSAS